MTTPLLTLDPERAEIYADRDAWLAGRKAGEARIGASLVHKILDAPWEALEILTGQAPAHDAATLRAFARGHRWERMVIDEYAAVREVSAQPIGDALGSPGALVIARHATEAWAVSSPDAAVADPHAGAGLVECKTDAGGRGWAEADCEIRTADDFHLSIAPAAYVAQTYWQMETTGLPFVDLVCLLPRYALRVVRVWADPAFQREILDTVGAWRERHVLRGEPLPVDGSDACTRAIVRRFPGSADKALREATSDEAADVIAYVAAKRAAAAADADADELRNRLLASVGDGYGITLPTGGKLLSIPTKGRETVSLSEIAKADPELSARLAPHVHVGAPSRQVRTYGID